MSIAEQCYIISITADYFDLEPVCPSKSKQDKEDPDESHRV